MASFVLCEMISVFYSWTLEDALSLKYSVQKGEEPSRHGVGLCPMRCRNCLILFPRTMVIMPQDAMLALAVLNILEMEDDKI
jgi:hypothetical protein